MGSALVLCTRRTDDVRSGNKGTVFRGVVCIRVIVRSMLLWFNLFSLLSPQSICFVEGSFLVPACSTTATKADDTNAWVHFLCLKHLNGVLTVFFINVEISDNFDKYFWVMLNHRCYDMRIAVLFQIYNFSWSEFFNGGCSEMGSAQNKVSLSRKYMYIMVLTFTF